MVKRGKYKGKYNKELEFMKDIETVVDNIIKTTLYSCRGYVEIGQEFAMYVR